MEKPQKTRVAILYRVIQEWRLPVFNKLATQLDLKLFYGSDFDGTKIVSSKKEKQFKSHQLYSFQLKGKSQNDMFAMPISPFLFFQLIKYRPKVVITEGASNLFNAIIGFVYCAIFRKKYIWWSLGVISKRTHTGWRKKLNTIINFIEKRSDAIISYSTMGKAYFMSIGVPEHKIFVATNVIDTDSKLLQITKLNRDAIYTAAHQNSLFNILFVGAINKTKNIDVLICAFAKLQKIYPTQVRLDIVGKGSEKQNLEILANELKVSNVFFAGEIFDGVSEFFLGADVFVLPGLGGLAVSDALTHGIPVIAGIGDGCEKDLIQNWENGIVDEDLDEEKIFFYLQKIYDDKTLLANMKLKAQQSVNKNNINTYLQKILEAIE